MIHSSRSIWFDCAQSHIYEHTRIYTHTPRTDTQNVKKCRKRVIASRLNECNTTDIGKWSIMRLRINTLTYVVDIQLRNYNILWKLNGTKKNEKSRSCSQMCAVFVFPLWLLSFETFSTAFLQPICMPFRHIFISRFLSHIRVCICLFLLSISLCQSHLFICYFFLVSTVILSYVLSFRS